MNYDALLVLSFGGPDGPDDVIPFLENVLRGRNVPRERMLAVAEHYYHFGGRSPINDQNRALIAALEQEFQANGVQLPIYWGNRNWHPLLQDTLQQMIADNVRRALVFVTSAFSSYSGCRQYRENMEQACLEIGPQAPELHKLRSCFNHPLFIETWVKRATEALQPFSLDRRQQALLLFTAHSIPTSMAATSAYEAQLQDVAQMVSQRIGVPAWQLVYQSRSGPPQQPWLEPDILDALEKIAADDPSRPILLLPIGFVSDHMEVLYDLDDEAARKATELGLEMVRVPTPGTDPLFVQMIREMVQERMSDSPARAALGSFPACPDICPTDCCKYDPPRRPVPGS